MNDVASTFQTALNLRSGFRGRNSEFNDLADLVKKAILNVDEETRKETVDELEKRGEEIYGKIKQGYVLDDSIFLVMQRGKKIPQAYFLCKVPKKYDGRSSPKHFDFIISI